MEDKGRKQYAVLWTRAGYNREGMPRVNTGTELKVRWENDAVQIQRLLDTPIKVDAFVVVNIDVTIDSIMWQGQLKNLPSPVTSVDDLYKVVAFKKIPDVKGRKYRRVAMLQRYGQTLPDIV